MAEDKLEERIYTVPLREAYDVSKKRRAPKAVQLIKEFMDQHMDREREDLKISEELNKYLWSNTIDKPPRKVKVRVIKRPRSIKAFLPDEEIIEEEDEIEDEEVEEGSEESEEEIEEEGTSEESEEKEETETKDEKEIEEGSEESEEEIEEEKGSEEKEKKNEKEKKDFESESESKSQSNSKEPKKDEEEK